MKKPVLLIPVENQVRELDAKLLLACIAAKRDLTSIIGPKRKIENHDLNLKIYDINGSCQALEYCLSDCPCGY